MRQLDRSRLRRSAGLALIAVMALAPAASARDEEEEQAKLAAAEADEGDSKLSGFLSFDASTNFMSYGLDVWGTGTFDDLTFNPSFGLEWDFGSGVTGNIGTWWDVNDNAESSIGGHGIQEVDVWVGLGYSWEGLSTSVTYQEWMYGGDSERIVDFTLGYDVIGSPSLTVHGRVDGNNGQNAGAVFVLGGGHEFDLGGVASLSPSVNVAFVTDDFYVDGEGGFGYVSTGLGLGIPLSFIPSRYGDWAFQMGGTYYYTDPDNINNPHDNIFVGTFGVGVGF